MKVPNFTTERLLLREIVPSDIPAYEQNFVDYEVISELSNAVPWPYPPDGVKDFLTLHVFAPDIVDRWTWGICERIDTSLVIGGIDLRRHGHPEHRGFWLGRKYWGQGYMTEAVWPIIDHAFSELGFEKLIFSNAKGNLRSRRVKEKTGAKLIKVEPSEFRHPAYTERELWELTPAAWRAWCQNIPLDKRVVSI